nr:uncharacterized protein LOC119186539 [Rhipicephalus microplus]
MSMDWPADDEAGHEPEKNEKYARLEKEIISLRKKLVEERKRNQNLQDVAVKGMGQTIFGFSTFKSVLNLLYTVFPFTPYRCRKIAEESVLQLYQSAAKGTTCCNTSAISSSTSSSSTNTPATTTSSAVSRCAADTTTTSSPALMPVTPQGAQHCSEAETTQKDLRNGIKISQEKWLFLMAQPKNTLFVRDTAKAVWGIQNLYNRSITGTPCRRFLHKEDGGPPSVEKQALTPRKLDALRNAYEEHLKVHESQLPDAQRRRNMNGHLADLLKVLKK